MPTAVISCATLQLASAVDHCHHRGVVNCDIKNANVLITEAGDAKLSDFGLASILGNAYTCVEPTGQLLGSRVFVNCLMSSRL
jgi:serine/threonine-protein kinase